MAYDLIPAPKVLTPGHGGFTARMDVTINVTGSGTTPGEFIAQAVQDLTAFQLDVVEHKGKAPALWMSKSGKPTALLERARRALKRTANSQESYALVISPQGIAAVASGQAGLFYAATTAAGLVGKRRGRPLWPTCTVSDWPDLSFRGVHLDLKHHMERFWYIEGLIPRLAAFKINAVVLELEDKFLYKRRPEISAPVGFSAEDLKRLVALCKKYHIEFVPLVQGLGHVNYILKHPKYASLREKKGNFAEFCPLAKGTYDVLFDLYEEVAEATEGTKYFHIGGDEAWLVGSCPKCKREIKKSGKIGLFLKWLDRAAGKIRSLGRVPMVWDDMLIKHAGEDYSTLPDDLFYVRWNYRPNAAERCAPEIRRYSQSGLKVIVAASTQTGTFYVPHYNERFANIDGFAKAATESGLTGILTTAWEDSGNHTETFWPGFAATGQGGWNSSVDIDFEFLNVFTRVFHKADGAKIAAAYRTLGLATHRCFELLTSGSTWKCDKPYDPPTLVVKPEGQRWRDKHAERIMVATELAASLREVRKVLSREILSARRKNTYALEVLLAADRIMLARVKLFFALRDTELAIERAHSAFAAGGKAEAAGMLLTAASKIEGALDEGEAALTSLEAVWGKTRFPQDMSLFDTPGKKYLHDFKNYDHLACRTKDLSYHLFVERRSGARELAAELRKGSQELAKAKAWPW